MGEQTKGQLTPVGRVLRMRWLWVLAAVVLLGLLVLVMAPYAIGYGLKHWLVAQGGRQVAIHNIDFNPFTGRFVIEGLDVVGVEQGPLRVPRLVVALDWLPLWRRRVYVEQVTLSGADLTVRREDDGTWKLSVVGFAPAEPSAETEKSGWAFGAQRVTILDSDIHVVTPEARSSLRIDKAHVVRAVAWRPEQPASVDFRGNVDGAQAHLQAEVYPFRPDRRVKGKLTVSGLALGRYAKLISPELAELAGDVDLHLVVQGSFGDRPAATQAGRIRLRKVRAAFGGMRVAYEDTTWTGKASARVPESGSGLLVEIDGALEAAGSSVEQAGVVRLSHKGLVWSGLLSYRAGDGGTVLTSDGKLDLTGLGLELEGQSLRNQTLSWSGKTALVLAGDTPGKLTADGTMRLQDTELASASEQLKQGSLDWKGKLSLTVPAGSADVAADWQGQLEGKDLHVMVPAEKLNAASARLVLSGSVAYARRGGTDDLVSDGTLSLGALKVNLPGQTLQGERLDWKGKVKAVLPKAVVPVLRVQGRLVGGAMTAGLEEAGLRFGHAGLVWQGAYDSTPAAAEAAASTSTLTLEFPRVVATATPLRLAGADRLQMQGIQARGPRALTVGQIVADKLRLVQPEDGAKGEGPALVRVGTATVTDLTLRQPLQAAEAAQVAVGAVRLESLVADLHRAAGGAFPLLADLDEALGGSHRPAEEAGAQGSMTGKPTAIRVGSLELTGESQVRFRDDSVKPAFVAVTDLSDARILNLDSARPDQESPFVVAGTINEYARFSFKGDAEPFADRLTLDATGELRNARMPLLSPYTVAALGYSFTSGKMDAKFKLEADQGKLDGQNDLVFQKLEVKRAKGVDQAKLKLDMPLETALALVRGKGGTIRLKVPVSGDVADPKFSLQDAINTALAKATQKAALTYLAFALQPYGSILLLADLATDVAAGSSIALEAVKFAPASAELDKEALAYLEKLNKVMNDRPALKIKVCGQAVEADRLALRQKAQTALQAQRKAAAEAPQKGEKASPVSETMAPVTDAALKALARQRAQAVEAELVNKRGIDPERVFVCEPVLGTGRDATPRVEIRI